jgi:hypothetical protein
MKLLNVAAGAATGALCYRFCRDTLGRDRVAALLAVILLAASGVFVVNVSSPLETTSCGTLLMATLYALSRYLAGPAERGWGSWPVAALGGALLAVWRIDSVLLVAALGAALLVTRRFRLEERDWLIVGSWALVFLAYTAFRLAWFGDIVNNPFHAKVKSQFGLASPFSVSYVTGFFRYLGGNTWVFVALVGVALLRAPRRYAFPAAVVAVQWLYIATVNGDWMPAFRFWAAVLPCICILITGALDIPWRVVSSPVERLVKLGLALTVAGYWFAHAQVCHRGDGYRPFRFYAEWRDLPFRQLNPYWQTADWLNAHVSKTALMAIQEAGYIPFLTGLAAIDTYGLCDRELARVEGRRNRLGLIHTWDRSEPGTRYILSRRPDVLVIGPCGLPEVPQRILDHYLLVASPQKRMFVFRREDSPLVH